MTDSARMASPTSVSNKTASPTARLTLMRLARRAARAPAAPAPQAEVARTPRVLPTSVVMDCARMVS